MNHHHLIAALLITVCAAPLSAQPAVEHYQNCPDYICQMLTGIMTHECTPVSYAEGGGIYHGFSRRTQFFGWGSYRTTNGNRWIGLWDKGSCIFGILIKGKEGRVGSSTHYTVYDLVSGTIDYTYKDGERHTYSATQAEQSPYRFVRINYESGDYYIGETKNGKRHGQGIYHWANGDYWYGTFSENYRQGYGALFSTDGTIDHGMWLGNDKQE